MAIGRFGKTLKTVATALAALALVSLVPIRPALADAPRFYTIPINWTYTSTECGFSVLVHEEGEIAIRVHSNNGSNDILGVDHFQISGTFTNPANDVTL